jgi:hypothetical protein
MQTKIFTKKSSELKCTIEQMDSKDTYRVFHSTALGYTFFLVFHRTFSTTDHILGSKNKS